VEGKQGTGRMYQNAWHKGAEEGYIVGREKAKTT